MSQDFDYMAAAKQLIEVAEERHGKFNYMQEIAEFTPADAAMHRECAKRVEHISQNISCYNYENPFAQVIAGINILECVKVRDWHLSMAERIERLL